jgi:hypothetical protein
MPKCKTGGCWVGDRGQHTGVGCGCDCHSDEVTMTEDRYKLGYRQAILDVLDFLDSKIDSNSWEAGIGDLMKSISRLLDVMK